MNISTNNIDILIWSKDRACQLDLLLRSLRDHFCNYGKVYVRYDYSNEEFSNGYDKVIHTEYDLPLQFVSRNDFEIDTKNIIFNHMKSPYALMLCDDDVCKSKIDIGNILDDYTDDVSSISLRMSKNITKFYSSNITLQLPIFLPTKTNCLKWNWQRCDPRYEWGYPSAINIHVYKIGWLRSVLRNWHFEVPNRIECLLNTNRHLFAPHIISFNESKIFNIPVNQTQKLCPTNPFGIQHSYSCKKLNDMWLNNQQISTSNIYGYNNCSVNEEISLKFQDYE